MTLRFACRVCSRSLEVPREHAGKRVRCGGCQSVVYVPRRVGRAEVGAALQRGAAVTRAGVHAAGRVRGFYARYLRIDWLIADPELTRCVQCRALDFAEPGPCAGCGGSTVGLEVSWAISGEDQTRQAAATRLRTGRRVDRWLAGCGATVGLLTLAYFVFFRGKLALLLFGSLNLILVLGVWATGRWLLRSWLAGPRAALGTKPDGDAQRRGRTVYREVLWPYLSRTTPPEGGIPVPEGEEATWLEKLLQEHGFESQGGLGRVLECAALVRDHEALRARLEAFESGGTNGLCYAFALWKPTEGDDAELPHLRQLLRERGEDHDPQVLAEQLRSARAEVRELAFREDLKHEQANREGFQVTIEGVDAMDPYSFEYLLGAIYESLGYRYEETPPRGDQGADAIVERGGERTVIQAKLYTGSVGNDAVQQAVGAKAHYGCQRAAVVTNSTFTRSAKELAESNRVELVDRDGLIELLAQFNERPKNYAWVRQLLAPRVEAVVVEPKEES